MRAVVICMALCGCATGDLVPIGSGSISWNRVDMQGEQRTDVIYSNDVLHTTQSARVSRASMPSGSYRQARDSVEAAQLIAEAEDCVPDALSGTITANPPTAAGGTSLNTCNLIDFAKTRAIIVHLLPPWPTPSVEQVAGR